jgi:hypothetical protein
MKTFSQYLAEAGIRRKQRVAAATERSSWDVNFGANAFNPNISNAQRSAAIRTDRAAHADVNAEQARRVPRIVRRATAEAEAHTPTLNTPKAKIERMGNVGELATEWGKQMLAGEKPGFVQSARRSLGAPRGNDGY